MQHRPPGEAVGGELGPLLVVEVEGVESLDDGATIRHARGAARPLVAVIEIGWLALDVTVPFRNWVAGCGA